ncbi:MAG: AI-2E family transporter [Lachnospiraceae bacterium]|nr:AI-2E family transporter [Lachnospiraceae bacterium]
MNLDKNNMKKVCLLIAFAILLSWGINNGLVFLGIISYLLGLISPFIIGAAMAFVLNAPMRAIEKNVRNLGEKKRFGFFKKNYRVISIILTLILVIFFIWAVFMLIIPELGKTAVICMNNVQPFLEQWKERAMQLAADYPDLEKQIRNIDINWVSISQKLVSFLSVGAGSVVKSTVNVATTIVSVVVNIVLALIFAIYVLTQKEKLSRQGKKLLYAYVKRERADWILRIMRLSNKTFSNFVTGQFVEACILGLMFFVMMTIFRLPYAIVISVVIVVSALIPMVGAFIGCVFGVLLIIMVSPMKAVAFVVLFLVLQQIEGNIIYPRVVGNSIGLPAIWVLVAITLGGNMMGIIGMLIFIPICSVCYTILGETVNNRLEKRGIDVEKQ